MDSTEQTQKGTDVRRRPRHRRRTHVHSASGRPHGTQPSRHSHGSAHHSNGPRTAETKTGDSRPGRRNNRNRRRSGGGQHRRPDKAPALTHRLDVSTTKNGTIPPLTDEDTVRIIPVSGVEEIGRNMNIIETKDDIIVIDAGFQFVSE